MKLSKLIIKNIASITDATIDFTINPLKSSELFLITGPTGAGKSTILDCISLALFKNTPRLKNCQMQGKVLDADNKSEINISGPQQLMRSNTVACSATLFFTGNNGVHYKAEWAANRADKKLDGRLYVKWELQNLDDNKILSKNDEGIKKEIQKAIGLDFEQFSRTTMLAQGDFSRFLNSKDEEKAKILEKITGTEIYTKIGKKIFDIKKDKEAARDSIKAKMNVVDVLSDEGLQKIIRDKKQKSTELSEKKSLKESLENKKKWLLDEQNLQKDLEDKNYAFNEIYKYASPEEYENDKQKVKDWEVTSDVRTNMKRIPELQKDIETNMKRLNNDLKIRHIELLTNLESCDTTLKVWNENEQILKAELKKHESYQNIYDQEQTINAKLDSYKEFKEVIEDQNNIITQSKDKEAGLKNTFEGYKKRREDKERTLEEVEKQLEVLNISKLSKQKDTLKTDLGNIQSVKDKYEVLCRTSKQRNKNDKDLKTEYKEITKSEKRLKDLEDSTDKLKSDSDELFEKYQKSCDSVNEWAQKVRQSLKVGDICPVCRQQISTALPTEEQISALFKDQKDEYDKKYQLYKKSNEDFSELKGKLKSDQKRYDEDLRKFKNDTSLKDCKTTLDVALKAIGFPSYDESSLMSKENDLNDKLDKIEKDLTYAEKLRGKSKRFRKYLDNLKKLEGDSFDLVKDNQDKIELAKTRIKEETPKGEDIETYMAEALGNTKWRNEWTTNLEGFRSELNQRSKDFNGLRTRREKLQANYKELHSLKEHLTSVRDKINEDVPDFASLVGGDILNKENFDNSDWKKKADELRNDISNTCTLLHKNKTELSNKKDEISKFIEQHPTFTRTDIEKLACISDVSINNLSNQLERIKLAQEALNNSSKNLNNHKKTKPEFSRDETIENLESKIKKVEDEEDSLNQEIGALDNQLKENGKNLKKVGNLQNLYNEKNEVYKKWEAFCSLIGDSNGKQFCKIAQSYVLANLVHAANTYMKNLSKDRYVLKVIPGTFIILVEDAYEGFHARPASTISGGETFLVSLSLALALSDIGQSLSVDTLFIDEGFGTLSGAPLNDAINTLKSLHSATGRKVGIISHIEQLKNLIPTQIEVSQNIKESKSTITII